jgi:hypothetical protein
MDKNEQAFVALFLGLKITGREERGSYLLTLFINLTSTESVAAFSARNYYGSSGTSRNAT